MLQIEVQNVFFHISFLAALCSWRIYAPTIWTWHTQMWYMSAGRRSTGWRRCFVCRTPLQPPCTAWWSGYPATSVICRSTMSSTLWIMTWRSATLTAASITCVRWRKWTLRPMRSAWWRREDHPPLQCCLHCCCHWCWACCVWTDHRTAAFIHECEWHALTSV